MKQGRFLLLLIALNFTFLGEAQYAHNYEFMIKRQAIGKSGMIAYTSWSGLNLAVGITSWATLKGEAKYFGQMNVVWSIINLGIALPGLLGSFKTIPQTIPSGKMIQQQYGSETIYLINGGLDFLYLGVGTFLRGIADNHPSNELRFKGYGDAFLINGGFLLLFDFIQYFRHRHARKSADNLFLKNLSLSTLGFGFRYTFN